MNRKNVIRTLTAIAVVLLLGWSFFYFSDDTRGYKPVDTSVAMAQINSDNVKSAQIDDREQQLRLELKNGNGDTEDSDKIITKYPTGYGVTLFDALQRQGRQDQHRGQPGQRARLAADLPAAAAAAGRLVRDVLPHADRRPDGLRLRQVEGQAAVQGHAQDHVRRRRRRRRGGRGALRDQGLPAEPDALPGARRQDPQGRAAVRPARHRQDAAGPRRRRRGRGAVLHHLGLGLRRDVRRRRRLPRARPVRAGQAEQPVHHLRRRDRRRRPPARRRPRRRPRRTRADAEPAAGRDGRLRRTRRASS